MMRVIKVGGRAQTDPALARALASVHERDSLVIVHGGGDEVSTLQHLHGATPQFRGGRRITSSSDIQLLRMALSGSANKRLVSALTTAGVPAVGISGEDAGLIRASVVEGGALGAVGTPSSVNVALLRHLMQGGYLPVVSPVSANVDGAAGALNVNGDDAAAAIAAALAADELLFVSDVAGVHADGVELSLLDLVAAQELIESGRATGGMCAKLQAAIAAVDGGVGRVRISDVGAILSADRGTELTRAGSVCT